MTMSDVWTLVYNGFLLVYFLYVLQWPRSKNFLFALFISLFFTIFALISKCSGSAAGIFWMREESPGNTGRSTSETRSYW